LVETLADRVATCCLGFDGVVSVHVTVLKPDVLPDVAALGVRVRQTR
jgi:dihydroneopterin aldolase